MRTGKELKYLWVYSAADEWTTEWHEKNRVRRLERGFDIRGFCNTPLSLQRQWFPFSVLDRLWKTGYSPLLRMYEDLAKKLVDCDVLILYNGANLHPEFVSSLKNILKIYTFGDPESFSILGGPIGPPFDIHLVNQFSEIEKFKEWGAKHVYFWPLGSQRFDKNLLNEEKILDIGIRPISASIVCEYNSWRSHKLDALKLAFPKAIFGGKGWGQGRIESDKLNSIYLSSQIGWNIHNTTGFNFRTYDLLAAGAMQICDNNSDLAKILVPNKEVIGFDTVDECIELTKYYLAHPKEQREIALAGWTRWKKDYTPDTVWDKLVEIVENHLEELGREKPFSEMGSKIVISDLKQHKIKRQFITLPSNIYQLISRLGQKILNFLKKMLGK